MDDADGLPDPALGVFDTMLVRGGRPVDLEAHVERLARSVTALYGVPVEVSVLAARVGAGAQGLDAARVRTTYDPVRDEWTIGATRIEEPGLEPRTAALRRIDRGLGEHKWVDRRLVVPIGVTDDVIVVDHEDRVLECGTANLFAVVGGTVVTPPLDGRILPGTVRARLLDLLRSDGVEPEERPLPTADLASATEVFGTSAIRGVQPVVSCPGVGTWPVGEWTIRLREATDRA